MNTIEAQKALDAATAGLRTARADVMVAQARVLEWEAQLLMAQASMARLSPTVDLSTTGQRVDHQELREMVLRLLRQGGPRGLTVDDLLAAIKAEGAQLPGTKPRPNLLAYLSRWEGIATVSRGHYMPFKAEGIGIPGPGSHGGEP